MAITIRTPQEIEKMRRSGQVVREVLEHVRRAVKPGASTLDLEQAAAEKIRELGATPAFKGYHGYPCVLCTSINSEVVHGIPSGERKLRDGDLVSIDTGVVLDGYYGDSAITVAVGSKVGAEGAEAAGCNGSLAGKRDPGGEAGSDAGRCGRGGAGNGRGGRLQRRPGFCGARDWHEAARRPAGSELRPARGRE